MASAKSSLQQQFASDLQTFKNASIAALPFRPTFAATKEFKTLAETHVNAITDAGWKVLNTPLASITKEFLESLPLVKPGDGSPGTYVVYCCGAGENGSLS